jgi:hypothetical protein
MYPRLFHRIDGSREMMSSGRWRRISAATCRLEVAVAVAEEGHAGDAELGAGLALLLLADRGEPLAGHRGVRRAARPVGEDEVAHLGPQLDEPRDRAGRAELGVVGVGDDDERPAERPDGVPQRRSSVHLRTCRTGRGGAATTRRG